MTQADVNEYQEIIERKFNLGIISASRYEFLIDKVNEWVEVDNQRIYNARGMYGVLI